MEDEIDSSFGGETAWIGFFNSSFSEGLFDGIEDVVLIFLED